MQPSPNSARSGPRSSPGTSSLGSPSFSPFHISSACGTHSTERIVCWSVPRPSWRSWVLSSRRWCSSGRQSRWLCSRVRTRREVFLRRPRSSSRKPSSDSAQSRSSASLFSRLASRCTGLPQGGDGHFLVGSATSESSGQSCSCLGRFLSAEHSSQSSPGPCSSSSGSSPPRDSCGGRGPRGLRLSQRTAAPSLDRLEMPSRKIKEPGEGLQSSRGNSVPVAFGDVLMWTISNPRRRPQSQLQSVIRRRPLERDRTRCSLAVPLPIQVQGQVVRHVVLPQYRIPSEPERFRCHLYRIIIVANFLYAVCGFAQHSVHTHYLVGCQSLLT